MKSIVITVLLAMFLNITLNAEQLELTGDENNLKITGSFEINEIHSGSIQDEDYLFLEIAECKNTGKYGEAELPVFSRFVSLPASGNFVVSDLQYDIEEIDLEKRIVFFGWQDSESIDNDFYLRDQWLPEDIVTISNPNIMRGNRFAQITIAAVQYNPFQNKIRKIKNVDIEFEIDNSINENPLTRTRHSTSFDKIAEKNIINSERIRDTQGGQYLFICPDNITSNLAPLLRWKEKLGFKTRLATTTETGSTNTSIKNYLQNAYDNWENPPEYVVLVGDVSGSIEIPAFFVEGYLTPWDVTDHNYTLLEGTDYFPDIMLGRFSVQDQTQLNTIINKIIKYESDPYIATNWIKRALMITYVSEYRWQFYSPRETVLGIREKLLDFEYTEVDTFISPWTGGSVLSKINTGHSFVNYRGAGGPLYWYEPYFTVYDINNLTNGYMLPMVTSMTCGGGDFATYNSPSCFGETWLHAGSPTLPKGAISFIGPSEHDTKTPFNNSNDMGIYQGITQEGLFRCGEMLLRGKMELYNNYPYLHGWGGAWDSDQFYFYVYNLLGDPGLAVWTDTPKNIAISFNPEFVQGMNFIDVEVLTSEPDKSGFTIAITNSDSLVAVGYTEETGHSVIISDLQAGSYSITASKYGFIPITEDLTVTEENIVSLFDYTIDDAIVGATLEVESTFKNLGDIEATDIQIELISEDEDIQVVSGNASISSLSVGQTFTCCLQIQISENWRDRFITEIILNVSSNFGEDSFLIPLEIISPELCVSNFIVNNTEECLIQNTTSAVDIQLLNCGSYGSSDFSVILSSLNENAEIVNGQSTYQPIAAGENGINEVSFEILAADVISGELARFKMQVLNPSRTIYEFEFTVPIGIIDESSPTFSEYGYFAIESEDSGNFTAPEYNWIEIDPSYGGSGTLVQGDHITSDGYVETIILPFEFQYFGESYDNISVCSNGWLAMGETNLIFFHNRNIPSGTGPRAMIAPFWDYLNAGNLYVYHDYDEHYYVIEWSRCRNVYNYNYETFEVILFDPEYYPTPTGDGEIKFQYNEIHNVDTDWNYATIGIENEDKTEGLLMTFANIYPETVHTLQSETAILFTTVTESFVNSDDPVDCPEIILYNNYPNPF
ncbi:MAG: hypothetical protein K8R49_05440, partial [Candidatus Cloacimonetes bacterium]|nr:hypothetical protein [Candidatus Cloacimonadota bacterium]